MLVLHNATLCWQAILTVLLRSNATVMRQAARDVIRKYELYGESDASKGKRSPQVLPGSLTSQHFSHGKWPPHCTECSSILQAHISSAAS